MADHIFPRDFKEFLKLLNDAEVKYLLIGGYAVGYHGYPRTTADMDVWVAISAENALTILSIFPNGKPAHPGYVAFHADPDAQY